MKILVDQERTIYNEDREKLEGDLMRVIKSGEAKIRLVRNKLLTLYEGDIDQISDIDEGAEQAAAYAGNHLASEATNRPWIIANMLDSVFLGWWIDC